MRMGLTAVGFIVIAAAALSFTQFEAARGLPKLVPKPSAVPRSYFGMTVHRFGDTAPWPPLPFSALRTWDTDVTWAQIQPQPDKFVWSSLDRLLELAQNQGMDVVFTLGRTPRWASAKPDAASPEGPGQCAPPAKMEYWDNFIRQVVAHTAGKIGFWETWNEPQNPDSVFYCGDLAKMVELQKRTFELIKEISPDAKVLTPSPTGGYGPPWMSQFLAKGGGEYADIMSFHGYLAPSDQPEAVVDAIAKFKSVLAQYKQTTKPVWDTEAGWGQDEWLPDPDLQAAYLAKFYLLHWSAGIDRLYWYAYDNEKWGTLWDPQNGLTRAGIAYRAVQAWLQGAVMNSPCTLKASLWTCGLERDNGYRALVIWSSANAASSAANEISLPAEFTQYRDLAGDLKKVENEAIPISRQPLIVENKTGF